MTTNTLSLLGFLALILMGASTTTTAQSPQTRETIAEQAKIEIKVVVVTMFEIGDDQGDKPGEFQLWKQNQQLTQRFAFPAGFHDLYLNPETGVLGIVTGMGNIRSAAAIILKKSVKPVTRMLIALRF